MAADQELMTEIEAAVDEVEAETQSVEAEVTETGEEEPKIEETQATEETQETHETQEAGAAEENKEDDGGGSEKVIEGDEEAAKKLKEAPDETITPVRPRLSDEVLTQAARVGISIADAREFGSEAALLRVIDITGKSPAAAEAKENPLDALPKLDPEHYDEDVIKTFDTLKGVVQEQRDQIELLMNRNTQREQFAQHEVIQELETWFDGSVGKLGDDFVEVLGKGGHASLAPGSSQLAKREAIADQIGLLMGGYEAANREAPSRDELFATAARSILGDEFQAVRDRKVTADLKSRSKQHIARPGSVKVSQEKPVDDEVAAKLDAKYFSD